MKNELEDWLTELPPLDGAEDEPDASDPVSDDLIPSASDDPSLDDAAADDLEIDDGVEIADDEAGGEDDDRWEADVGEAELDLADDRPDDTAEAEPPALNDADLDVDGDLPPSEDDSDEEGTTEPIEHSLDEELPPLDSDDEGDFEDALLMEGGFGESPAQALRWASEPWTPRPHASQRVAWAAVDDDAITSVALSPDGAIVVASAPGGELFVSQDGGKTAASAKLAAPFDGAVLLALTGAGKHVVIWAAHQAGHLTKSTDFGRTWARCPGIGRAILALTANEDGSLSALARKDAATELLTSSDGARWFAQKLPIEMRNEPRSGLRGVWVAHRPFALAISDGTGIWVSREGHHFVRVPNSAGATAGAFAGSNARAPFLFAAPSAEGETVHLVRVADDGSAEIVGDLGAASGLEEPIALALAWDEASHALRVAFSPLIVGWGPSPKDLT